jgi:DNA-binding MarR family transcriptional regulator
MNQDPLRKIEEILDELLRKSHKSSSDPFSFDSWQYPLWESVAYTGNKSILRALGIIRDLKDDQNQGEDFFGYSSPRKKDINGSLRLGVSIPERYPFGLEIEQLNRNILIVGSHGTGKTNAINLIIDNLYKFGFPFLIIDVAKKDSRHLIRKYPEIQVIPAKHLRLNPLEKLDGVSSMASNSDFADAYSHQVEVMQRSKSYIVKTIKELWDRFGGFNQCSENPNLEDMELILFEKLKIPGKMRDDFYLKNHQRVEMLLTMTEDIFRCSKGFPIEKLLARPTVVEIDELSEEAKTTVILFLLTRILRYRITRGERGRLKNVIVFDEGKRVFDHNLEKKLHLGIPPLDYLVSYARDLGLGLIVADQEASKLTDTIKSNTNTKFSFMIGGGDILEAARICNLNQTQRNVLQQLTCGTAIVKMDEKYTKPFLVQFDYHPIERNVTDLEVEEHSWKFIEDLRRDVRPRSTILLEKTKKQKEERVISRDEEALLIHTAKRPELTVSERFKAIGFTNYVGDKTLKGLFYKGYITKIRISTGQRGNQPIILDITEKGRDYLKAKEIRTRLRGKGGIVHQWWQKKIQEFYKHIGQNAVIEPNVGGLNSDILVFGQEGKRVAVEVALSHHNQVKNIQRDLKFFDKVIVASEKKTLMKRIEAEAKMVLSKDDLKRVKFCLLRDFLP